MVMQPFQIPSRLQTYVAISVFLACKVMQQGYAAIALFFSFYWLTPEVRRVLKTILGNMGDSGI